jgi:hypothetical protein
VIFVVCEQFGPTGRDDFGVDDGDEIKDTRQWN